MIKKKKTGTKDSEPWSEVSAKLDTLIRLSALNVVKGIKTQKEQIAILSDAGFQPKAIADTLSTSRNTVSVTLNVIKKEREAKEKSITEKEAETSSEVQEVEQIAEETTSSSQA